MPTSTRTTTIHMHMRAAIDACDHHEGVRCVEVWHSDSHKLVVEIDKNGQEHTYFWLIKDESTYGDVYDAVGKWLNGL